jgi:hypothetical protein
MPRLRQIAITQMGDGTMRSPVNFIGLMGASMSRFVALSLLSLLAMTVTASAQTAAERHKSGCTRDVVRHCRAKMNDGDMVVLACLKEHRSKLSKACARTLAEHGQ